MTKTIHDGGVLAGSELNGVLVPADTEPGRQLARWIARGVPGLRGRERDGVMVEEPRTFRPDHPLFGLALLEHLERIGWTVDENG